jgi:hypothetical protein
MLPFSSSFINQLCILFCNPQIMHINIYYFLPQMIYSFISPVFIWIYRSTFSFSELKRFWKVLIIYLHKSHVLTFEYYTLLRHISIKLSSIILTDLVNLNQISQCYKVNKWSLGILCLPSFIYSAQEIWLSLLLIPRLIFLRVTFFIHCLSICQSMWSQTQSLNPIHKSAQLWCSSIHKNEE